MHHAQQNQSKSMSIAILSAGPVPPTSNCLLQNLFQKSLLHRGVARICDRGFPVRIAHAHNLRTFAHRKSREFAVSDCKGVCFSCEKNSYSDYSGKVRSRSPCKEKTCRLRSSVRLASVSVQRSLDLNRTTCICPYA